MKFLPFRYILSLIFAFTVSIPMAYTANYYVNDADATGDVFCTSSAIGNDANTGAASNIPKLTVASLLNNTNIGAGDTIFIDTGAYPGNVLVTSADGDGASGNYIVFKGAGRTKTIFTFNNSIFDIQASCSYIKILDMKCVTTANNHVIMTQGTTSYITIDNCELIINPASATTGVQIEGDNTTINNCTITSSGFGIRLLGSSGSTVTKNIITNTFNNSDAVGIWLNNAASNTITNNKCYSSGPGEYGMQIVTETDNNLIKNNYLANYRKGVYCNDGSCNDNAFYYNSIYATEYAFWGRPKNWNIQSNIFYTSSNTSTHYCYYMNTAGDEPTTLNYNLYYHPNAAKAGRRDATEYSALSDIVSGTIYEDNGVEGDPLYASTSSLDLTAGSAAIDLASDLAGVTDDVRYAPRALTDHDIGAFEYGSFPLPIELLQFSGKRVDDMVQLKWSTALEINNDYFVIERSADAMSFSPIGLVEGAGNSHEVLNYSYNDYEAINQIVYYRLKQVDYDGVFSYTPIVATSASKNVGFALYSTIVSQENLELVIRHEYGKGMATIQLYNMTGILIASETTKSDAFEHTFRLNKNISPGYYVVKISSRDQSYQKKIVVY